MVGDLRPTKKRVVKDLILRNPLLCMRANVNDPMDYIQMAEDHGIVVSGDNTHSNAWVSMNDDFVTKF